MFVSWWEDLLNSHILTKMRVAHYALLPLLFLSQLVSYSALEYQQYPHCPAFHCGNLGEVHFPFSNTTNPECGLCVLNCTEPEPKVKFNKQGKWYPVTDINFGDLTIKIYDEHLETNRCGLLGNFTEKVSPFLSIHVAEFSSFIRCNKHEPYASEVLQQFDNYTNCKDYDLYFYGDQRRGLQPLPKILANHCSIIRLPFKLQTSESDYPTYNHTAHWVADFTLTWFVRHDCYKCNEKGGRCQNSLRGSFVCGNLKKGNDVGRKFRIGVGSVIGCILLTCIIFLTYLRRKRIKSSTPMTPNSGNPSMKQDHEQGSIYFQTPIFTYSELDEATNHFDNNKKLGDGGFGTVYHGRLRDGRDVAVKRLFEHNYKCVEHFRNEIVILSRLRHPNLVPFYGCTERHSLDLLLVYEFVPNGTVADHLRGNRANDGLLTWPIRMSIAMETSAALAYLHASDIIHRDVKTNNILLDKEFHVKVADFGLSRLFPIDVTHVSTAPQGTPGYVDPEYYQCYQLNDKSDVYSFGVVLIELISSKPAVDIGRHRHEINLASMALNKIHNQALHELVDPYLGFNSDDGTKISITLVAELAFRCLQQEKEMRPCMMEVMETLQGIESKDYRNKNIDELDIPAEIRILKNSQPLSSNSIYR